MASHNLSLAMLYPTCPRCHRWPVRLGRWRLCSDCNRELDIILDEYNDSASDRVEDGPDTSTIEAHRALHVLDYRGKYLNLIDDPADSDDDPT